MTLTMTKSVIAEEAIAPEVVSPLPSKRKVLDAIVQETGEKREDAGRFLVWIIAIVHLVRTNGYQAHLLSYMELDKFHHILDAIVPDNTVSVVGSAHHMLEQYVLDASEGELTIRHGRTADGEVQYCKVDVMVGIFG